MKNLIRICFVILLGVVWSDGNLSAQSLSSPSMTNFNWTPPRTPKITHKDVSDYNVGQGRRFHGNIEYRDGVPVSYNGHFYDSNGNMYCGLFNPDFGVLYEGGRYVYIPASKDIAIIYVKKNGDYQEVRRCNIKGRSWYVYNAEVYFSDESTGGGYNGGGYTSGSTSGTGSSYNSHAATCRGCNGTGRCQHCGGSGWVNNYKSKCSLCHGSGTCVSCHGQGKVY